MEDSFLLSIIIIILIIFIVITIINSIDLPSQHPCYEKPVSHKKPVNIIEELMSRLDSIDKKLSKDKENEKTTI